MNALLVTVFCDNFVSYGEHFLKYLQSNKVAFADVQNEHYIEVGPFQNPLQVKDFHFPALLIGNRKRI